MKLPSPLYILIKKLDFIEKLRMFAVETLIKYQTS